MLPLPYKDNYISDGRPALATWALILLMGAAWLWGLEHPGRNADLLRWFAFVPKTLSEHPVQGVLRMLSSPFLHGGFLHLAGNALFLVIFGRAIEGLVGSLRLFLLGSFLDSR